MVSRVGSIAFTVTDLERSVSFARSVLGLSVEEWSTEVAYLSCDGRHHQLRLRQGSEHACESLGFDVADVAALDEIAARAAEAGIAADIDRERHPGIARSLWLDVPNGPTIELCAGVDTASHTSYSVRAVRPKKLGHVTMATPDLVGLESFFVEILGFRLSDRIPGVLAWLRCNSDHHGVGIMKGEPGLNHYAFELESWGSLELLADHLSHQDIRLIWGPGRHGPGANLFSYFEDADRSLVECFADILQVEDEATYRPGEWPDNATSLNRWGPAPDPQWFTYTTPYARAVLTT